MPGVVRIIEMRPGVYSHPIAGRVLSFGAAGRVRTRDLLITNQLLFRLSYDGINKAPKLFAKAPEWFCMTTFAEMS